jgi:hypothetical protein
MQPVRIRRSGRTPIRLAFLARIVMTTRRVALPRDSIPVMELALMREIVGALLAALIALLPPIPHPQRERIQLERAKIVSMAAASSARYRVPPSVLLVVGYLETHLGTDDGEGGGWGAPIDALHPHKAGTSDHAARILARGRRECGSWQGALSWFRSGQCLPPPFAQKYVHDGVWLIERMHRRIGLRTPEHLYATAAGEPR